MRPTVHMLDTPRHIALARALQGASRALLAEIRSWVNLRRQRQRARAQLQALHALDDATLRDLGLSRSELGSLSNTEHRGERRHHVS